MLTLMKQDIIAIIVVLAFALVFSGCIEVNGSEILSSKKGSKMADKASEVDSPKIETKVLADTPWNYNKTINTPLKANISKFATTLGNLETNCVLVEIPEKTFSTNAFVTIKNPDLDRLPKVSSKRFRPIGAPIEINAVDKENGELLRTNEPVTITMKIDRSQLERSFDRASVQIAYYNGEMWEFIKPQKLDLDASTITYCTYCTGIFGYGRVSVDEQIAQYVKKKSITEIGKALVKSIGYEIPIWKYAEIDAAYRAYQNGANGSFWGYRNNTGEFDQIWNQMYGFGYQLEKEAIRMENKSRKKAGLTSLTKQEIERVQTEVRDSIEKQFENRADNKDEIAKKEVELKSLIDAYRNANLMEPGIFGYAIEDETIDERIDSLLYLRDKILRDTGRKQVTGSAVTNEKVLSIGDLVILSQMWYSKNGRSQYERYLKDEFGIDISNRG